MRVRARRQLVPAARVYACCCLFLLLSPCLLLPGRSPQKIWDWRRKRKYSVRRVSRASMEHNTDLTFDDLNPLVVIASGEGERLTHANCTSLLAATHGSVVDTETRLVRMRSSSLEVVTATWRRATFRRLWVGCRTPPLAHTPP